ncbi:ribosomal protein S12 methylthiotransferase accessory factor [Streptomyces sp. DvalAA-14]|uniref:TOMM precursor leader peptide-binding protein n=1 Tax=unclassified Streptomyces TaxID=2593676 RepID=UPI00081B860B|nr:MULTISPECIES: TOMM precursor leader peptide-binding protein [unclassified Streptomyces]MYS23174.1 TOMM precursor leader peptide-binding protein [Streptomyces sp. SID4948]SCE28776.1 ribosomal protein S12 methylthiotransferase accessory factor [Streptomyces sp. DvalAA-14]
MTETPVRAGSLLRHDGGRLGLALEQRLAALPRPPAAVQLIAADTVDAGSELADAWRAESRRDDAPHARAAGAWLPVVAELDRIVIGPLVRPGVPGCDRCLAERRAGARVDAAEDAALHATYGARLTGGVSPLLTPLAADLAACVALREPTAGTPDVTMIRLADLRITRHTFLPDPHCPHCGGLPEDSPAAAAAAFARTARLKPDPAVLRMRDLRSETAALENRYADDETGVIKDLRARGLHALPFAEAKVGPRASVDGGYGRALDFRTARVTAIAEALERLGGGRPGGRRTAVEASYRALAAGDPDGVLDPARVGGHEPHRYRQPGFPYQPYRPELVMPWVWGYSLTRERPVLVPESLAYYRIGRHSPQARPFVSEISNGCALGGCPEEAALYGLLELAERDAFLLTWYARMPAPTVDLRTARDRRLGLLADHIRERTGYRVEVFDVTGAEGIPSFWAAALDTEPRRAPHRPSVLCAGGSGLDPERGIFGALHELVTAIEAYRIIYPQRHADAARMREDPELVRQMDDHALLYCDPLAARRLDFLLSPQDQDQKAAGRRDLRDMEARYAWPRHTDLRADLDEVVRRFSASGLEAIVVDQTTPVHAASGLSCVKAVVPGLLPMTFGHQLRRVAGLDRVLSVPRALGRAAGALGPDGINPHPHPFP